MKTFLGRVIAVVFGIGIFIFLCFMFFSFIGSLMLSTEKSIEVDNNSVLVIKLDEPLIENLTEQRLSLFEFGDNDKPTLLNILQAIEKAEKDDNIKGISLELDMNTPDELSQVELLRNKIKSFKKSGKFVYAYSNRINQTDYYLASVADSIFHNPLGVIELKGLSTEVTFYKNLGEKYGIGFDVIRHGKYKAAVEPFIRDDLSEENKTQLTEIISSLWNTMATEMSTSRGISLNKFNEITDNLDAFLAEDALRNNLVDVISHESEYHDFLKKKINSDLKNDLSTISLNDYAQTISDKIHSDKIAVLYAEGMILPGDKQFGIQSEIYKETIKEIAENKNVKAVVLRINSGGGDANTSDEILYELKKLHAKVPIIVSFGEVAASGGYYIAQSSDKIYAEPYTITGSIGVLGMIPNGEGFLKNIGITHDYVQSNENSVYYSPFRGLTPHAKEVMTKNTESVYNTFITHVANNRKMSIAQVDSIGGGRVYTGPKAKTLGLVDAIGTLEDAIGYAAEIAKVDKYSLVSYPVKKNDFELLLNDLDVSAEIKNQILSSHDSKLLNEYLKIEQLSKLKGSQVLWPYDFKLN